MFLSSFFCFGNNFSNSCRPTLIYWGASVSLFLAQRVVNHLCQRFDFAPGSPAFGKAFENWVFHELCCYAEYSGKRFPISYWRLSTGVEVDFILGEMEIAIEVKATALVNQNHLKSLRELAKDYPLVKKAYIVSLDQQRRYLTSTLEVLPYQDFVSLLWSGELVI